MDRCRTSAASAEGPDTLTRIQALEFSDVTATASASGGLLPGQHRAVSLVAARGSDLPESVVDSAANVAGDLDGLQSLAAAGDIGGVLFTDSGTGLHRNGLPAEVDADVIGLIEGPYNL